MFDALFVALSQFGRPDVLLVMLMALPVGILVGLLPGISGLAAFTFLIPFTYNLDPVVALAFLMTAHAAVSQGGSITAITIGVPGEISNAATIPDGYALAKKGRAGYAIGAALTASAVGGLFGCVVLILLLPLLQAVVYSFQSPENFFLALAGICFIALLASGSLLRALAAGGLGIFLAMFGYDPIDGAPRFWMEQEYLLDGIGLVPLAMGLFAVPELIELMTKGNAIAGTAKPERISLRAGFEGVRATLARPFTILQSATIGTVVGVIPGAGGSTAPFIAYAAARQSADKPETFGTGRIEGVIAPESCNNAKEGGSLVPTLALGIPGSSAMAMLLGAFVMLGLQPGPEFLTKHADLAFSLAAFCAVGNIVASALMFLMVNWLTQVTFVPGRLLAPILLVFVVVGTYAAENRLADVFLLVPFGALGLAMARFHYSRPALLLGFVLGDMIERYFHVSMTIYGADFMLRPISLAILILIVLMLAAPTMKSLLQQRTGRYGKV